jgi:hypothetical protein
VALGRLLLAHCDTLLLDEPYTGPDTTLRRTLTTPVGSLVAERSIPAVLDPPYFGLDGSALAVRSAEGDTVRTEQVHQLKDGL